MADYGTLQDIVDAVATEAGQSAYTAVGALARVRREGPPRVIWVPRSGSHEPAAEQQGNDRDVCVERRLESDVYFVGVDYAAAETLLHAFTGALFRSETRIAARTVEEEHDPQGLTDASRYEIRLRVQTDIPVAYRTRTSVTVQAASQTGTITE